MKIDNIANYEQSLLKLIGGVNKVCNVIKPTYGPNGSNVVIEENQSPGHRVSNDGKLISNCILLADPIEQIGANILNEACERQDKEAGDGRKTTIILTTSILNEGIKVTDQITPLELKRQLDDCLPVLIKSIDDQTKPIEPSDVHSIATTASESPELGKIIGDAYKEIGRDGIVEIEPSTLPDTYYEVIEGIRIRSGWFGGYWQTEDGKCILKNPRILITKDKITDVKQILPVIKELRAQSINELVIYCEDIELMVASTLAKNTVQTLNGDLPNDKIPMKFLIIKAPILWKDWLYEDFSKITGAQPVDSRIGKTFSTLKAEHLGTCEKLVCSKEETRVMGIKDVKDYIETLKIAGLKDDQQLVRASWLNTKVAVLKVGAHSDSELSWKIKKSKDATHASYWALQEGVVTGSGQSLEVASRSLTDTIGAKILATALNEPSHILGTDGHQLRIDGIIDPAIVIKSAITNAISIAGIILTTKGVITIPAEIKEEIKAMNLRMQPR
jgi:chaperonin GroEL